MSAMQKTKTEAKKAAPSPAPSEPKRREHVVGVLVVVLGLLIGAGGIAVWLTSRDDSGGTPQDVGVKINVQGTLPGVQAGGQDPGVGQPVPTLSGAGFDGQPIAVPNDGKPHAILFIAHWCTHCQALVPQVLRLNKDGWLADVELFAVATTTSPDRPNYPPSDWLAREGWAFPTIADDAKNEAAARFGVTGFPFWVFVDKSGNVAARIAGEISDAGLATLFRALSEGRELPITRGGAASPP